MQACGKLGAAPVETGIGLMRIAIDGPAGAGKSSVAKEVAKRLGFTHLDSGAMYRALTLAAMRAQKDLLREEDLLPLLPETRIRLDGDRIFLNGEDVSASIRSSEIDRGVTRVAVHPAVRAWMVGQQREFGRRGDVVADGRDIATVVWPDAELKVFLVASLEARAKRRLLERHGSKDLEMVQEEIKTRDENDTARAVSPLKAAQDAVVLDTTDLSLGDVIDAVIQLAEERRA